MRAIDRNIAISAVVGLIATSLSFIPFVGYFSLLGWGSALYFITQRTRAYDEYKESLNLLAATCNWSLGEGDEERQSPKEELTRNADIRDMMTSLYPVVTEKQARHLIADDIEKMFVAELNDYESKYTGTTSTFFAGGDDSIARSKRVLSRCLWS